MMNTKQKYDRLLGFVSTAIVVVIAFFFSAWVFVLDWDWTAVPLFHAVPAPYTAGLGAALIVSYFVALVELFKERK